MACAGLGEATTAGKLKLWATGRNLDLLDTYLLFGDPAMPLRLPPALSPTPSPTASPTASATPSATASPTISPTASTTPTPTTISRAVYLPVILAAPH